VSIVVQEFHLQVSVWERAALCQQAAGWGCYAEFQQGLVLAMAALVMVALALLVLALAALVMVALALLVVATVALVMVALALLVVAMAALPQQAQSLYQELSGRSWEPHLRLLNQQRLPGWTAFETLLDDSVFASSFFTVNKYEQGSMYRCCKNKRSIFR
jgi:predicted PurR-regulated permease PerM